MAKPVTRAELTEEMTTVRTRFDGIDGRLDGIAGRLDTLTDSIGQTIA